MYSFNWLVYLSFSRHIPAFFHCILRFVLHASLCSVAPIAIIIILSNSTNVFCFFHVVCMPLCFRWIWAECNYYHGWLLCNRRRLFFSGKKKFKNTKKHLWVDDASGNRSSMRMKIGWQTAFFLIFFLLLSMGNQHYTNHENNKWLIS